MKIIILSLMFSSLSFAATGKAHIVCDASGSFNQVVKVQVLTNGVGKLVTSTTFQSKGMPPQTLTIESDGDLSDSKIYLYGSASIEGGTTEVNLERDEVTGLYALVKSVRCDWFHNEERCPVGDDTFHETDRSTEIKCTRNF